MCFVTNIVKDMYIMISYVYPGTRPYCTYVIVKYLAVFFVATHKTLVMTIK